MGGSRKPYRILKRPAQHPGGSGPFGVNIEALMGVAALRRGETDNCIACCTDASCIFPLAPAAVHLQTAGSRQAIKHFTNYLEKRPEDIGVRWLLNIAYMTVGEYPAKVPAKYLIPIEPFRSKIEVGQFHNVSARVGLDALGQNDAGGCIVDDFNGDGLLDVFTSNVDPERGPGLFINRGDGTFEERSEAAGLADQVARPTRRTRISITTAISTCCSCEAGGSGRTGPLCCGTGVTARSRTSPAAAGLIDPIASHSGAWADYDNDGFVDLYMVGEIHPNKPDPRNRGRLYHNNGNGTFTDVAASAGVLNDRWGKGAAWGDYDNDGDPDLYVSNNDEPNRLYRNNGDGTFTDVAPDLEVTEPYASFACWWWDYDNDGRLDLFVCNFGNSLSEVVRSHLGPAGQGRAASPLSQRRPRRVPRRHEARPVSTACSFAWGPTSATSTTTGSSTCISARAGPSTGTSCPNVLLKNVDGERFEDVTTSSGTGHLQKGHGVAFADWDRMATSTCSSSPGARRRATAPTTPCSRTRATAITG